MVAEEGCDAALGALRRDHDAEKARLEAEEKAKADAVRKEEAAKLKAEKEVAAAFQGLAC